MPRRRVAVALLPPPDLARRVQALRHAVDDPRREDLPPHLTLVPPINVTAEGYDEGRALLRSVAASTDEIDLEVGPAGTFAPATPTLHLELHGDTAGLAELRARVRSGPYHRPDVWPFHPHVTLREEQLDPPADLAAAVLSGSLGPWRVDRLHLLEQRRTEAGRPYWVPVAEEPLGPAAVVGRGGIAVELRALSMVPEEAVELLGDSAPSPDPFGSDLVVTAAEPGAPPVAVPLGVALGASAGVDPSRDVHLARLGGVFVEASARGQGIGRHLLRRWCHEAATRGAQVAVATLAEADPTRGLLASEGFVVVGSAHVRQLVSE